MKIWVEVSAEFEAIHNWPDAVNFLKYPHRHKFYVQAAVTVQGKNREIEFFEFKNKLKTYLLRNFDEGESTLSCEHIAICVLEQLKIWYLARDYRIKVSEDNENSAIIEFNTEEKK